MTPPVDAKPAATATPAQLPAQLRVETLEATLAAERQRTALLVEESKAALAKMTEMELKMAEMELALAASQAENQALRAQYKVA